MPIRPIPSPANDHPPPKARVLMELHDDGRVKLKPGAEAWMKARGLPVPKG